MNEVLKQQEMKERILKEMDILQFLDMLEIPYEDVIDLVYESLDEEQRTVLENILLSS